MYNESTTHTEEAAHIARQEKTTCVRKWELVRYRTKGIPLYEQLRLTHESRAVQHIHACLPVDRDWDFLDDYPLYRNLLYHRHLYDPAPHWLEFLRDLIGTPLAFLTPQCRIVEMIFTISTILQTHDMGQILHKIFAWRLGKNQVTEWPSA